MADAWGDASVVNLFIKRRKSSTTPPDVFFIRTDYSKGKEFEEAVRRVWQYAPRVLL